MQNQKVVYTLDMYNAEEIQGSKNLENIAYAMWKQTSINEFRWYLEGCHVLRNSNMMVLVLFIIYPSFGITYTCTSDCYNTNSEKLTQNDIGCTFKYKKEDMV